MLWEGKVAVPSSARTESARNSPLQSECTPQSVQWASCSLEEQLFLSWYKGLFTLGFDKNSDQTLVWFLWTLYPTRPWLWAFVSVLAKSSFSKNLSNSASSKLWFRVHLFCSLWWSHSTYTSVLVHDLQRGCQMSKFGFEPKSVWHQSRHVPWKCYIPSHIFFYSTLCEFPIFSRIVTLAMGLSG